MIDDDTIKKMATQAGLGLIEIIGLDDRERAFARAIWSHGRQAGLREVGPYYVDEATPYGREVIREIESEVLRRVKEANE